MSGIIFSTDDYLQPQWAAAPKYRYYFEIIKEGNLLGQLPIKHKSFNLIGRLQDLCDIFIDNQTVSRKHAIIQFKADDSYPYLYDLGGTHGTTVNKERIPMRSYKKLMPYDNCKFGVSSRSYVFRCPQLQKQIQQEEEAKENQFAQILINQKKVLSKSEMKEKYLWMLQNDPIYNSQTTSRKLLGRQEQVEVDQYEGIDWGISDEREVYAYRNDHQFPIEPDLLRRLHLEQPQLNKLAQYEENMRKYQQLEADLNELANKEKREFGLEEKLQDKKEKLQKKFIEGLEQLQRSEEWLRVNIFGQVIEKDKTKLLKQKQKENDTYGDDDYLDRTLQNKQKQIEVKQKEMITTEDYWQIEKELKEKLAKIAEIQSFMAKQQEKNEQKAQQADELDVYMNQTTNKLNDENKKSFTHQIQVLNAEINSIKSKLVKIVGENKANQMVAKKNQQNKTSKEQYLEQMAQQQEKARQKRQQQSANIEEILSKMQKQKQQLDQINELDVNIFKYYDKRQADDEEELIGEQEEIAMNRKRHRLAMKKKEQENSKPSSFEKPLSKYTKINENTIRHQTKPKQQFQEEQCIDLTSKFR